MEQDVLTGLVAFFGVVVGANLQYFFTTRAQREKHYAELRSEAYVDFMRAFAGLAIAQRMGNPEREFAELISGTDAKARIAIYGSKPVAKKLAEFMREHGSLTTPEANLCMTEMVALMRREAPGKEKELALGELANLMGITLAPNQ